MAITHSKVSAKADGGDPSLVLPSEWNAAHTAPNEHVNTQVGHNAWHGDASVAAHHAQAHPVDSGSDHSAGTLGDVIYAAVAGAWARLTGNITTTRKFLRQTGTGAASAAPAWDTLVDGDLPTTLAGKTLTSPVVNTQLTGTAVGTGASQVAAGNHTHAASGALTRAGGNLVEATTSSTAPVELLTTSSLSIGASVPLYAVAQLKKSTGAANTATAAATANATTFGGSAWSSNANTIEAGFWQLNVQTAQANYDAGGTLITGSGDLAALTTERIGGGWPVATLTSLAVRAWVANASITMGADEMHVYAYATS